LEWEDTKQLIIDNNELLPDIDKIPKIKQNIIEYIIEAIPWVAFFIKKGKGFKFAFCQKEEVCKNTDIPPKLKNPVAKITPKNLFGN